ncbi:MAG TPA: flavodoxin domain-containing protein [bacterium]|nr:flavodoxin domain-containing protein [bacterium]
MSKGLRMRSLIIYDSVFGNTKQIAEAISQALGTKTIPVNEANLTLLEDVGLLVVGSPTRGFRPTPAISQFLKSIPTGQLCTMHIAGFDTRIDVKTIKNKFFRFIVQKGGYAAHQIVRELVKKGGTQIGTAEGFFVDDREGPLTPGEIERAATWAKSLLN